jgi:hypothetical protein
MRFRDCLIFGALTAFGLSSLTAARSDQYPVLDTKPLCHGITEQSSLQEGFRSVTFDECLKAEQEDRKTMIKEWSTFSAGDAKHCLAEATMGGESSYTELLTCLEMARDVKALKISDQLDGSTEMSSAKPAKGTRHRRNEKP